LYPAKSERSAEANHPDSESFSGESFESDFPKKGSLNKVISTPTYLATRLTIKLVALAFLNTFLLACNGGSPVKTNSNSNSAAAPSTANAVKNNKTRELYEKNCVLCHQANGEGGTVKLEDEKLKVPSLKSDRARKHSDESMIDQIFKGGDGMPAFKEKLKPEEINDLVRFIREELQGSAPKSKE